MKQYILALCLLFIFNASAAREGNDTIKTLAQAKEFFDTHVAMSEEYQNTIQALDVIINSTEADDIALYGAKALSRYAWMLCDFNGHELALPLFRQALEYCLPGDSVMYYDILSGIGGIRLNQHDYKEAEEIINRSLAFHKRTQDSLGMVKDYYNIAILSNRKGRRHAAITNARTAARLASEASFHDYESHILSYLAEMIQNQPAKDSLLHRIDSINYIHNLNIFEAGTLLLKAKSSFSQNKYNEALALSDKCVETAKKNGLITEQIDALKLKAKILSELKDYPQAYFTLNLASEKEDTRLLMQNEKLTEYGKYSKHLLDWCENNIIKRNGHYQPKNKVNFITTAIIVLSGTILLLILIFLAGRYSLINKRRIERELADNAEIIISLKKKTKGMGESIYYLLHFYNNHNVLLEKIRGMARQGLMKESEQAAALRKIGNFASSNMLDKIDNEYTTDQENEYSEFLARLQSSFPDITETEKKLAAYLRGGLTTREICVLTGNQPRSVNMTRHRLRKCLQLGEDENLENYLKNI